MSKGRVPQATQLVDLALRWDATFFHTPEGVAYAVVESRRHRETWAIRSAPFRLWLANAYYAQTKGSPNAQAMSDALGVLEARARFDGATDAVFTRLAERDGTIYLDLADDAWRAVQVTSTGWQIDAAPPVRFRRPRGLFPLPTPQPGGRLDELQDFLNLTDEDWKLVAGWLLGALRPEQPFPVLAIHGEPGSGKSSAGRMLRTLIDPNKGLLRSPPREEGDLILQALNGWVVGYDNLSFMPDWLNDALCRLSTGAAFGKRQLYQDDEEVLFAVKRPIVYTSIGELPVKADLSDRTIALVLPTLARPRGEAELWQAFDRAHPRILGALLDVVSCALANIATTTIAESTRMVDFACWVTAGEPALKWKPGSFVGTYLGSREAAHEAVVEASAIGQAVLTFMSGRIEWKGNAKSLLQELDGVTDEAIRREKSWPKGDGGPRALSGKLRTIAKALRASGLGIVYEKGGGETKRQWTLRWRSQDGPRDGRAGPGTVTDPEESGANLRGCPGRDGPDGPLPHLSGDPIQEVFPGARIVRGRRS